MRKKMFNIVVMALFICCFSLSAIAQAETTLFKNVKVFNGSDDKLLDADVLVEGNMIKQVGKNLSAEGANVIDGDGRTLMPGMVNMHEHLMTHQPFGYLLTSAYYDEIGAGMLVRAQDLFDMGFTTVRDAGGWALGIKRFVDRGDSYGPRIISSGGALTQTGGHGDFRLPYQNNPSLSPASHQPERSMVQEVGGSVRADGIAEVRRAARAGLAAGGHFIKVMGGGGIASPFDPLTSFQYSEGELKAAIEEAENYGTYATIHVHTDKTISRAVDVGFKMVEHATIMSEATAKKMAEKGVIWSMQTGLFMPDAATNPGYSNDTQRAKGKVVQEGMEQSIKYAKKYNLKTLFGTDIIGPRAAYLKLFPGEWEFRSKYYSPFEVLQQATKNGGEAVELSGVKNPYPAGPLGVVEEGAYADILLVKGNPLENVLILRDYKESIDLIMKDGKIYKNTLN
ncbi:MAG: amidohydrolase family protein [Desulfuromonadales bacterium]|nr:amidohydrolase family protein [Desulfuromonadales bacterium]